MEEGQEQLEIMKSMQGKTLRELQRESLCIEENVLIAQKRVRFQRSQLQNKLSEGMEAKHLDERLHVQRKKLLALQDSEDADKKKRKGFKRSILELFEELKLKTTECGHLLESRNKRNNVRKIILVKRESFQSAARELEERERDERDELYESHQRTSKNLLVWQELNMRHIAQEKKEGLLRVNRLMAQQLREIQRKEAEQLREVQHMKAKFKLTEFDNELEFVAAYEMKKAEQLFASNNKSLELKKERRNAKKVILRLREQAKVANNLELNALKAKQLKAIEENRAKELKELQQRESARMEQSFEQEIAMIESEMKEQMDRGDDADMSSYGTRSGATSSAGNKSSASSTGKSEVSEGQQSGASAGTDGSGSGTHQSSDAEKKLLEDDEREFQKRVEGMREAARLALVQAEARLSDIEGKNAEVSKALADGHGRELTKMNEDFETKRSIIRKQNETEVMDLLKQHAGEKMDIQNAHSRELQSLEKAIELESQLHEKSLHKSQVASHAKSEFLSFVCHELRNPLSAIVAVVDMMLSNSQMEMDTDTQEHIQSVKEESELMCAIVNDVLDFAKIEARMLVLDPVNFNVHGMVHDLIREQRLSAKKTRPNIELSFDIGEDVPAMVNTDPVRIRQVLLNLVSNAVKFTYQGSIRVLLTAGRAAGPDTMLLEFCVKDTGVGIDKENLEDIFAAFSQAKPSITREFGGTGLGLSISKSLVERLGGTINVESEKGKGTSFTFSVKVQIVKEEHMRKDVEESKKKEDGSDFPRGINLLIVEDSATLRRLWCKLLIEQGCVVSAAGNGKEALDKCAESKYDVVLMDITMPVMSGDEAVKRLRDQGWDQAVIALTANAMESDKQKYLEAGMDAVLTKPCKMDNLKKVIVEQLKKRNNPIVFE
ncbi:signal transduction histidine kinase [Chloropicon primus]|uniref:histidine kinase n=1 Tax=Chloropicon primus TaxID=1764295 RepID=A0A5B8MDW7_9CHLO|nr:signal transduction histidine kinase [Chloropicon primus]|eukprot:QDZ17492.1 signal transduction histidine kinase [Chloropicon primus]